MFGLEHQAAGMTHVDNFGLRGRRMNLQNNFSFPPPGQLEAIKTFYAGINGADSFDPATQAAVRRMER